ncbi:MAG TPA: NUDIX domain-containing protein [Chryseolinea sp.]|jgi:ADP-ribose pyrophosphatase YjhB (NUDIX family)|nr:NUDIX domain-containing protein [Chryseolinea sp.]HZB12389.1 NUDIX domain-containing protein [Chryseolinea sp.]
MIIFINDVPVRILKANEPPDQGRVNVIIDASEGPLTQAKLIHHVWIQNVSDDNLGVLFNFLDSKVPTNLLSLYLSVINYDTIKQYLRDKFKVVKAAGGLVRKKEKFLMIYRMKKWDLPKGKIEKGEKNRKAAAREVEEECNVTVKVDRKICTTWHTYTMNKRAMIKKTRWYIMDVVDDTKMRPALAEDIEETRWMNGKEVYHALEHSYKSINYVFEQYYEMMEIKPAK